MDKNKEIEILFHTINYWYDNGMYMPPSDQQHIKDQINEGYNQGQLVCEYENKTINGWWSIKL